MKTSLKANWKLSRDASFISPSICGQHVYFYLASMEESLYEAGITDYITSPIPNISRAFKVPSINAVEIKHEGAFSTF